MTDRKKIIKNFEDYEPYARVLSVVTIKSWVYMDALELLKEQDAVPVIKREDACMFYWCCGSCGVAITEGDKFCRMCGKEVKWNA